jgi:4'-phosphopantetheinyl transferase EntD
VGIDVEKKGRNIMPIAPRFLASEELERWQVDEMAITRAWSAKESIYKMMAKPGLSFQEEIILPDFDQNPMLCQIQERDLQLYWEDFEEFVLTVASQI